MIVTNKNKLLLTTLIILISCNDVEPPTVNNTVVVGREQEMYLYGWYSPLKYQINLGWYDYYGCNEYTVSIPEVNYSANTSTEYQTNWEINMGTNMPYISPGSYFMVYVQCLETYDIDYYDSILVKTKAIDPIEDINVHVADNGYKDSLTFTHSSDLDINKWEFYHFKFDQNNASTHPHYFDISDPNSNWEKDEGPSGWWSENGWGTNKIDYYNYSKENLDDSFCYAIKITDDKNYSRTSQIRCSDNFTRNANNAVQIISATNNLSRRVVIEWEEYADPDFYQYILWRSEYEDMPEDSIQKLAAMINRGQTVYHDRYNVSDGKKWYYKLEVENQYGKSEISDIKLGSTRP
tara:strand:- start:2104 stop:3153 length:1050 start_codon:yes stop_codon:yes gene_type:complete